MPIERLVPPEFSESSSQRGAFVLRAALAGAVVVAVFVTVNAPRPVEQTGEEVDDATTTVTEPVKPSPEAEAAMAEAMAWLERDDEHSLERASARFADAAVLSPRAGRPLALQALAEGLLAASLVDELRAYESELARRSGGLAREPEADPDDLEPLLVGRIPSEELLARATALRRRADSHLSRAWSLAAQAEAQGGPAGDVKLARALARLVSGDGERAKALLQQANADGPWAHLVRALLVDVTGEGETSALEAHLARAQGHLIRARVELAQRMVRRTPPALDEADRLLDQVLERSPEHERARRLSAAVAERRRAHAVAEGPAP